MSPLFPRTVFRELARPLQHPEALCWDPLTERVYCGGEGGQIYAVTLEGAIYEVANTAACWVWRSTRSAACTPATGTGGGRARRPSLG